MAEVGTLVVLTLDVGGADTDTIATVQVTTPTGLVLDPITEPADVTRARWLANLTPAEPGEYLARWTVTGSGEGVQTDTVAVAPSPGGSGRSYADTAQLADYTGEAPPAGARRLLRRATRKVDELLVTAVYDVDDVGMPTSPAVALVLADATCAQVEWWGEVGDVAGTGAVAALAGAQIGTVRLPSAGAGGSGGSLEYAPDAVSILRRGGLTNQGPNIPGPRTGLRIHR